MSNQVARNSLGPANTYSPNKIERDTLTLRKNVAATGTSQAFGWRDRGTTNVGVPLTWDRLNGNDCVYVGNVMDYAKYQNPATKPYYTLSSNLTISGASTFVFSHVDNVFAITLACPGGCTDAAGVSAWLSVNVYNPDGTISYTQPGTEYPFGAQLAAAPPTATDPCQARGFCATLRVNTGQFLGVVINTSGTHAYRYQDKMDPFGAAHIVSCECRLDIQKL